MSSFGNKSSGFYIAGILILSALMVPYLEMPALASGIDLSGLYIALWLLTAGGVSGLAALFFLLISREHVFLRIHTAVLWIVMVIVTTGIVLGINKNGYSNIKAILLLFIYPLIWLPSMRLFEKDRKASYVWRACAVIAIGFIAGAVLVDFLT